MVELEEVYQRHYDFKREYYEELGLIDIFNYFEKNEEMDDRRKELIAEIEERLNFIFDLTLTDNVYLEDEEITVRNGKVYKYNKSEELNLYEFLTNKDFHKNIINKSKHTSKMCKIFDFINKNISKKSIFNNNQNICYIRLDREYGSELYNLNNNISRNYSNSDFYLIYPFHKQYFNKFDNFKVVRSKNPNKENIIKGRSSDHRMRFNIPKVEEDVPMESLKIIECIVEEMDFVCNRVKKSISHDLTSLKNLKNLIEEEFGPAITIDKI